MLSDLNKPFMLKELWRPKNKGLSQLHSSVFRVQGQNIAIRKIRAKSKETIF
jgi:hypothetical protein